MKRQPWLWPHSLLGWLIFVPALLLVVSGIVALLGSHDGFGTGLLLAGVGLSLAAQRVDSRL